MDKQNLLNIEIPKTLFNPWYYSKEMEKQMSEVVFVESNKLIQKFKDHG